MGNTITKAELKRRVIATGGYFFSRGAVEFFRSRLETGGYIKPYENRVYFVTSEQYSDKTPREYRVRVFDGNDVDTIGDYPTLAEATGAAKFLAGMGA